MYYLAQGKRRLYWQNKIDAIPLMEKMHYKFADREIESIEQVQQEMAQDILSGRPFMAGRLGAVEQIEGGLGEYLKYNNSHKCGLYLASGIPAIVWKHSGMAAFIKEHECGIVIERLSELPGKIKQADYEQLKKNALLVSNQLQRGHYLKRALEQALGEKI